MSWTPPIMIVAALALAASAVDAPAGSFPTNPECVNAIAFPAITTSGSTLVGTTVGATQSPAPICGITNTAANVWYSVIGTGNTMTATTCELESPAGAADFNTKITVYCADCSALTCVADNDDTPGGDFCGFTFHSTATWCSLPGEEYLILMHGFSTETGNFELTVSDDGTPCAGAVACVEDCNSNGIADGDEIAAGTSADCNTNGVPDRCDLGYTDVPEGHPACGSAATHDCITQGGPGCADAVCCNAVCALDSFCCETEWDFFCVGPNSKVPGASALELCEPVVGSSEDCNGNLVPDECEVAGDARTDCNGNLVPDDCDVTGGTSADCNVNGVPDDCDIAGGTSTDCNTNGLLDACELQPLFDGKTHPACGAAANHDCSTSGGVGCTNASCCNVVCALDPFCCDTGWDLNCVGPNEFVPGASALEACGPVNDCNSNGVLDECDIAAGTSGDANANGTPDDCEEFADCNTNGVNDADEIAVGTSADCNTNGIPDECENDCNANGAPDDCDITAGASADCNDNGIPDECDVAGGTSNDCQPNEIPDECDISVGISGDCDHNGIPNECAEPASPGWNYVDTGIALTSNQPTYWSMATGEPAVGGVAPFPVLDPAGANGCPGRPDPDGSGERVLRGFVIAWAVNASGEEIRWNHLAGDAVLVNYDLGAAWEYTAYAFQVVNPAIPNGMRTGTSGTLLLNGGEYDRGYDLLLVDFFASGASPYGGGTNLDTDLTLMPLDIDLRQETSGPVTTKASFTVWNANEVKFTGLDRCITCWDQTLLSRYGNPNHFLRANLQTDRGKAQIDGLASQVCNFDYDEGDGILGTHPLDVISVGSSLIGVVARHVAFGPTGPYDHAGQPLVGMGTQSARIQADLTGFPPPERPTGGPTRDPIGGDPMVRSSSAVGRLPLLDRDELTESANPQPVAQAATDRSTASDKGSLLVFPKVELRWNADGDTLIQDTFISLINDYPDSVQVQMYFVNGDGPPS